MSKKIDLGAVKETVGNIAQAGVAQTKKLATTAKLKGDNMAQRDTIRKAYQAIGKLYYAKTKDNPEEDFAELFAKVDAAMATIAANEAALEELKKVEEVVIDVEVDAEDAAPAEDTTAEDAPVEDAPTEEAPAEEAPVEEAPVEDAPTEEPPAAENAE